MNTLAGHPVLLALQRRLKQEAERPCYPKRRYETGGEADEALKRLTRKFGENDRPFAHLNKYVCRFCHGYHLGNTTKPHAVALEGNVGTVSFEEMPIGAPEPRTPSRRERRRGPAHALPAVRRGKP